MLREFCVLVGVTFPKGPLISQQPSKLGCSHLHFTEENAECLKVNCLPRATRSVGKQQSQNSNRLLPGFKAWIISMKPRVSDF